MKTKTKKKGFTNPAPIVKCLLCGEGVKITKWRKHLGLHHGIAEPTAFKDYFVSYARGRGKVKCRFCGGIVRYADCLYHLRQHHDIITEYVKIRDYFVSNYVDVERVNRQWYNPGASCDGPVCGSVVNGPPKVRIIYNSIFSNRKKF